ncbi:MAG TPA: hypothetical protein DD381_13620 [Lentisphaeria bacterium]|nr:MAG: hypothetical protein A2X47_03855 [Lentisphaerae bacterium GWF2_38_69]HBM17360.1 hypothetical protein [Lentisphaeria bacterium]
MQKLNLLIIDDEQGLRYGIVRTLRDFSFKPDEYDDEVSFQISEAGTGQEALAIMDKQELDIALVDYKLPDINGVELLNIIREKKYNLLSVFITAYASLDVAVCATRNGAYDFLAKPFSPDELKNVIRKASSRIILQKKAKKLEEEKKLIRFEFLSVLSHELKAPLNAIESYLRIIESRISGEDIASYEKMIKRSLERVEGMKKLIFDLLDLTRIESGQKKRMISPVNLQEAASKSIETYQSMASDKGIHVVLKSEKEILINADAGEMEILFNNLISNAIKYNKDYGDVVISLSKENDAVKITVEDTGIGFKDEEKSKIFKEFVRCRNELTQGIEGSGLGLSILSKLVKLYDGSINLESQFGKGSKFLITLRKI